jgi:Mrp family chromosome partitioning ATPase
MYTARPRASGELPTASVNPMDEKLAERRRLIAHTVMVLSGKGGVGKSTVAANLAVALAGAGKQTGLLPLSIAQLLPGADGAVVVTTPQDVAVADVRRCIQFCRRVELPVLGVIENMSGLLCPTCGTEIPLFKQGGGASLAREMGVPFLGRIPIDPAVVEACDAGKPVAGPGAEGPAARAFRRVVEGILQRDAAQPAGSGVASEEGGDS